jgi:SAM-dependent methyltransferase
MDANRENWFESETFWSTLFPFMFPEPSFTAAVDNVPKIAALTGISAGNVLDLACGPGRYAVPLAQAGYTVTAVDRTRFLLEKGSHRAKLAGATVEWIECDMRDFVRPAAFDLAINVFTSFGYFDEPAENRRVLENVLASLKPGGAFFLDLLGKECLAARFQPTTAESHGDGTLLVRRQTITDDWSRIRSEWILIRDGRASAFELRHWLYSGREIREMLQSAGFGDVAIFGTFDGAAYDHQAQRLIAVARKPKE